MDYQLEIKQTYENKNDVDHFYPVTRAKDVKLDNVQSDPNLDLPTSDNTLDTALNKYNKLFKDVNDEMTDVKDSIETIRNNRSEMEDVVVFNSNAIEKLQDDMLRAETNISNTSNSVGRISTSIAEHDVALEETNTRITQMGLKVSNNEKAISNNMTENNNRFDLIETEIESLKENSGSGGGGGTGDTFVEITEQQIRDIFQTK